MKADDIYYRAMLARDYRFDGTVSEEVLRNYLSRSMTTMYLLSGHGDFDDNLRMLTNCGVKFAGRAVYQWGREEGGAPALPKKLELARANAARIHAADPELILQACIFEIVARDVNNLACRLGLSRNWAIRSNSATSVTRTCSIPAVDSAIIGDRLPPCPT